MDLLWKFNALRKYERCIEQLYADVNGAKLAISDRKKLALDESSFIYGEVTFIALVEILKRVKPLPGESFYDLGSGAGKAVLSAGLLYRWESLHGIELLPSLYQLSQEQLTKFYALPELKNLFKKRTINIQFHQQDILETDLSQADVIFINATVFNEKLWSGFVAKLPTLKQGARLIISSRRIKAEDFELIEEGMYLMSWGYNSVFIYRKR